MLSYKCQTSQALEQTGTNLSIRSDGSSIKYPYQGDISAADIEHVAF